VRSVHGICPFAGLGRFRRVFACALLYLSLSLSRSLARSFPTTPPPPRNFLHPPILSGAGILAGGTQSEP
jgi:hypothetical protein